MVGAGKNVSKAVVCFMPSVAEFAESTAGGNVAPTTCAQRLPRQVDYAKLMAEEGDARFWDVASLTLVVASANRMVVASDVKMKIASSLMQVAVSVFNTEVAGRAHFPGAAKPTLEAVAVNPTVVVESASCKAASFLKSEQDFAGCTITISHVRFMVAIPEDFANCTV
mmetsp:Transcript_4030/g.5891  ORF Transcript_4030/g.5891 Transcript_4030/m.5891 type:complete len:168 (+) Transcript_4030:1284-1787(+)